MGDWNSKVSDETAQLIIYIVTNISRKLNEKAIHPLFHNITNKHG